MLEGAIKSFCFIMIISFLVSCSNQKEKNMSSGENKEPLIIGVYAESDEELSAVGYMVKSIRNFGGKLQNAPIWVFVPSDFAILMEQVRAKFQNLPGIEVFQCEIPKDSRAYNYAGKTFASGEAERMAAGKAKVLVWLDSDTIFLNEPVELLLPDGILLGYRPIMHNRSGTLYGREPIPFWKQVYNVLGIEEGKFFPMTTAVDRVDVNPYFNAGIIAVRPEAGILTKWGKDFKRLCNDSVLAEMCRENVTWRIFLHQAALVGGVLNTIERQQMAELPDKYNYPLFFDRMFGADRPYNDISDAITIRYEYFFRKPDSGWEKELVGDPIRIKWLKDNLEPNKVNIGSGE